MSDTHHMKDSLVRICGLVNEYVSNCPYILSHSLPEITSGLLAYLMRPGKKVCPAVLIWSYLACGGSPEHLDRALPIACGLELTHTWTLIHDDIIDCDPTRRGGPSMHVIGQQLARDRFGVREPAAAAKYGETYSILIGDTMHAISVAMMLDSVKAGVSPDTAAECVRYLQGETMRLLIEGELLDVNFEYMEPEEVDCGMIIRMIEGKTSSLLSYSALAGAMLGADSPDTERPAAKALKEYAFSCGTAFQLKDDILGLTADEAQLGKPVGSDLREGKKTYPIYLALSRFDNREKAEFLRSYGNPSASAEELQRAAAMIEDCGALKDTEELAVSLVAKARHLLCAVEDSQYKEYILEWGDYMVSRAR
ncbi:MAG: polyprenyl synthetase family protein [Abditibacteriota bacterium]|nr:polyprenyl synthetase family protein [Abditibacteriota bacterium]